MKRLGFFTILCFIGCLLLWSLAGWSDNRWFSLSYDAEGYVAVKAFPLDDLDRMVYLSSDSAAPGPDDSILAGDSVSFPSFVRLSGKDGNQMDFPLDSIREMEIRGSVARLFITTDSLVDEIPDKENYLKAKFLFVGTGEHPDSIESTVNIRGRGNTTWFMPKKPYRLKFDKKTQLPGMQKAKSYVLVANYLDNTLMKNSVAFKMAELVGMDYYNTSVPVDLFFNGKPRGSYLLTEKIGINAGSVDIDEERGVMWEIDSYFDEEFRFRSTVYNLPCMLKDPDFMEVAEYDAAIAGVFWNYWKADLDMAIAKVSQGKWQEAFDAEKLARYVLVNHILGNFEISQMKSVYLYKERQGDKYCFGPVWDFDWALGYTDHSFPVNCLFLLENTVGYDFWKEILSDPEFLNIFQQLLEEFNAEKLPLLMDFIDSYADEILVSAANDAEIWTADIFYGFEVHEISKKKFLDNVDFLKSYIHRRIGFILGHPRFLLY